MRVSYQRHSLRHDPIYCLLFCRASANRLGHVWKRGSVQLNSAGLGKAKLLASVDCCALASRNVFLSARFNLAKDRARRWRGSERGTAIVAGALS